MFFFAEFAIAVAGWVLGINPFDQPNVQEAKDATTARVLEDGTRTTRPTPATTSCARCSPGSAPPHYLAILGFVAAVARTFDEAVAELRAAVRDATQRGDDVRLRPALPALDRPAPQGRPADRALPAADPRLRAGRRDPRRRLQLHAPQARAGDRRPRDAARARPPAERVTLDRRRPGRRAARAHRPHPEAAVSTTAPTTAALSSPRTRSSRVSSGCRSTRRSLVDLRRHGRPRPAQAAAGDLQPRPRGRAARALQPRRHRAQRDVRRAVPRDGRPRRSASSRAAHAGRAGARAAARGRVATCAGAFDQSALYGALEGDARRLRGRGRPAAEPLLLPRDGAARSSR